MAPFKLSEYNPTNSKQKTSEKNKKMFWENLICFVSYLVDVFRISEMNRESIDLIRLNKVLNFMKYHMVQANCFHKHSFTKSKVLQIIWPIYLYQVIICIHNPFKT